MTPARRSHMVYTIAVIGFIYTLHLVLPMYSNSSFLSLFADERTVGLIYMTGAAASILGYLIIPYIIRRIGNYASSIGLVCIQIAIFWGLISTESGIVIAGLFVLQMAVVSLIGLTLDVFLESYTDEHHVGHVRGLYTTVLNASWLIGPLLGGMLINGADNYRDTYVASMAMLFPLLYLIHRNFPRFKDPRYTHFSPWKLIRHILSNRNWTRIFFGNIILQTFYAWMIIYSPIYLNKTIGFSWEEIGIILTVMLIPFPLIQYHLGKLADSKYGEKEIMALGFGLMGVSTIILSFITSHSVLIWATALFVTRIGAAAVEIMMETYFFKTVSKGDTATLGMFRITRPFSNFMAPLITGFGLLITTHEFLFVIIGMVSLVGLYPALTIKDTR